MNDLINIPHTWINYGLGLDRFEHDYYDEGKAVHRTLQDHVCSRKLHETLRLANLPTFETVEEIDKDPRCRIDFSLDGLDDFIFTGFFDGYDEWCKRLLEVKTYNSHAKNPTPWSLGKFNALVQWRIYVLGLLMTDREVDKMYGVTLPRDEADWNDRTVRVYQIPVQKKDMQIANDFLLKAVNIVKKIDTLAYEESNKLCEYIDCPFGCEVKRQERRNIKYQTAQ